MLVVKSSFLISVNYIFYRQKFSVLFQSARQLIWPDNKLKIKNRYSFGPNGLYLCIKKILF